MAPPRARLQRLYRRLPDEPAAALRCAIALGERRGAALYLVGGGVRDLVLGGPHLDIDLVVEGDAIALAGAVAKELYLDDDTIRTWHRLYQEDGIEGMDRAGMRR